LLRARAIMKTFPADTYPGDRADMFEHLAAFNVYSDDRYIEYSITGMEKIHAFTQLKEYANPSQQDRFVMRFDMNQTQVLFEIDG
ncbi:hypothetical protein MJL81_30015, partial [Salmonella enterica subsp. enterica serovar Anatum]|nr:hypothetical protein [Salmonella enterica subsp. enterica serovar Anatum]